MELSLLGGSYITSSPPCRGMQNFLGSRNEEGTAGMFAPPGTQAFTATLSWMLRSVPALVGSAERFHLQDDNNLVPSVTIIM